MTASITELQSNLIPKDKLESATQSAVEIVADLNLPLEIGDLSTWNFRPSKELNSGSWSITIPGTHGETTLEITTYGSSNGDAEKITANWSPLENSESKPGVSNLTLSITKKPNQSEKREVSVVLDKDGSEGILSFDSDSGLPTFKSTISEPEPNKKNRFSFRLFRPTPNNSKTMNAESAGSSVMALALNHPRDPQGFALEIYTALNAGKSLKDLRPEVNRVDDVIKKKIPEALNRTTMAGILTEKFGKMFPDSPDIRERTSAFASARLVNRVVNQSDLPQTVRESLVSDVVDQSALLRREQHKVSMYPHLKLINAEAADQPSAPRQNFEITAPHADHDWDWQQNMPLFVEETFSTSNSGFEKTITLDNGSRLSIGVNAEIPSSHSNEGRSISKIDCEAPLSSNSPWERVQIIEIDGFQEGKINYIVFTSKKTKTEILIKTTQKTSFTKTIEEPIKAKILNAPKEIGSFGNAVEVPFVALEILSSKNPNELAIQELLNLNTEQLIDTARKTIHDFVGR